MLPDNAMLIVADCDDLSTNDDFLYFANNAGIVYLGPLLMAVAIGETCAFMTLIAHQANTLVMEPGGYRFCDYWRMGLPLSIVLIVVATPVILWVWPLEVTVSDKFFRAGELAAIRYFVNLPVTNGPVPDFH